MNSRHLAAVDTQAPAASTDSTPRVQDKRLFWLAVAFVAPFGASLFGFPIGLHHVLAPFAAYVIATRLPNHFARYVGVLSLAAAAIFVVGLFGNGLTEAPLLSAYHFLTPYLAAGLGYVALRACGDWAWQRLALLAAIPGAATLLFSGGRMTRSIPRGDGSSRAYSVGSELPFIASGAQVNTWGTYLIASMLVAVAALVNAPTMGNRSRVLAIAAVALSTICVSLSGSRANTVVAGAAILFFLYLSGRGKVAGHSRHRLAMLATVFLAAILLLAIGVGNASQFSRVSELYTNLVEGNLDDQYIGRSERVSAMVSDLGEQPLFGTGFHDFELNHPELRLSSPHNQWVGSLHKLGIAGTLALALFLWPMIRRAGSGALGRFLLGAIFVLGLTYDVFTAPPGGPLLLFLLGAVAAHNTATKLEAGASPLSRYG